MAFVVEDTTGLPTANAYVAVATVDAYFVDRNNVTWAGAVTADKQAAILSATRYIDGRYRALFKGYRKTRTQALEWPRLAVLDDFGWPFALVPQDVLDATCEAALRALSGALTPDLTRSGLTKEEQVGPLRTVYMDAASGLPDYPEITRILGRVIASTSSARLERG